MPDTYIKTTWVNDETRLNATNMNHIEDGIYNATQALIEALDNTAEGSLAYAITILESEMAGKQDELSASQLAAINSGITESKVTAYDNYAITKQNTLSDVQLAAVNSGITADKVNTYDGYDARITANATAIESKQDELVAGTNIKFINGQDILGSGNITIDTGSGVTVNPTTSETSEDISSLGIDGTPYTVRKDLEDKLGDLETEVEGKQDELSADQLSAVNSGITSAKVTAYDAYETSKQPTLNSTQVSAINSGITAEKVAAYDEYESSKQDVLNAAQTLAINSGITATKVSEYDSYATSKQNSLSETQLSAANSGITASKVSAYDAYENTKQDTLSETQLAAVNSGITSTSVGQIATNTTNIGTLSQDLTNLETEVDGKQDKLVTGTNIKYINGQDILGSGNITIDTTATFASNVKATVDVGTHEVGTSGYVELELAGKTLDEAMIYLYQEAQNPSVTQPRASITIPSTGYIEAGTSISTTYVASLIQGSYTYGPTSSVTSTAYAVTDTQGNSSTTASGTLGTGTLTLGDDMTYSASVTITHSADTVTPVNNIGDEVESLKIAAGTKSATSATATAYRACFYGYYNGTNALSDITSITSAQIRSFTKSRTLGTFTLSTSMMKQIVVAFPAGKYSSVTIANATTSAPQNVSKTTVSVEGANGYTAIEYDVYYVDNAAADSGSNTYRITVA